MKKQRDEKAEFRRAYDHAYYMVHREKVKARTGQYAKDHPEKYNEWSRKYRLANPEKVALRHKKYNKKNAEKIALRTKAYREKNYYQVSRRNHSYYINNPEKERTKRLKKYGLTSKDYDAMFVSQSGVCAICGNDNKGKRLHVDHNHETGKVRELLCTACNLGLGSLKDSEVILEKAAMYLRKHKE